MSVRNKFKSIAKKMGIPAVAAAAAIAAAPAANAEDFNEQGVMVCAADGNSGTIVKANGDVVKFDMNYKEWHFTKKGKVDPTVTVSALRELRDDETVTTVIGNIDSLSPKAFAVIKGVSTRITDTPLAASAVSLIKKMHAYCQMQQRAPK